METFSALLAICAGNSPVIGEFPAQRPVTRSFDVFLSAPEPTVEQTMEKLVTWDATALIRTSLLWLWDIIVCNGRLWSCHSEIMARLKVIPSIISWAIKSTYRHSSSTVAHRPRCIFVSWESFILVSATPGTYIFSIFSIHCVRNSGANYPRWLSLQVELQMHLSHAHKHLEQMAQIDQCFTWG